MIMISSTNSTEGQQQKNETFLIVCLFDGTISRLADVCECVEEFHVKKSRKLQ